MTRPSTGQYLRGLLSDPRRLVRVLAPAVSAAVAGLLLAFSKHQSDPFIQWAMEAGAFLGVAGVVGWNCYHLGRSEERHRWFMQTHANLDRTAMQLDVLEIAITLAMARRDGDMERVWRSERRLDEAVMGLTSLPPREAP